MEKRTTGLRCEKERKGPFWYNEIPPKLFFNLHEFKAGRAPLYQQKWQREILDPYLDIEQRKILRNQRLARIYFNPMTMETETKEDKRTIAEKRVRDAINRQAETRKQILDTRKEEEMCALYGVKYKDIGGSRHRADQHRKVHVPTRSAKSNYYNSKKCMKARRAPPYKGRHALNITPWEVLQDTATSRDRFQVKIYGNKMTGLRLNDKESKDVQQYKTTPLAVWRQYRFHSPVGADYREIKEQICMAKYAAMAQVQESRASDGEDSKFALAHASLTSHFKPWEGKRDENPDCEDYFEDEKLQKEALEEAMNKAKEMAAEKIKALSQLHQKRAKTKEKKKANKQGNEGNLTLSQRDFWSSEKAKAQANDEEKKADSSKLKSDFVIAETFFEDLTDACKETRKGLLSQFAQRPLIDYYPDPRDDPELAKCFKKGPFRETNIM